jgi:hypothetical protein
VSLFWVRTEIKNRLLALLSRRNLQHTSSKRWQTVRERRELEGLPLGTIRSAAWIKSSSSAGGTIPEFSAS